MEDKQIVQFTADKNREVVRIRPDGTWWVAPDITPDELQTAFFPVVETAAKLLKTVYNVHKVAEEWKLPKPVEF